MRKHRPFADGFVNVANRPFADLPPVEEIKQTVRKLPEFRVKWLEERAVRAEGPPGIFQRCRRLNRSLIFLE
jgi:hypothetical protein